MTDREKRGQESNRKAMRMVVLILQLGITMMTSIFLAGLLGRLISEKTGSFLVFPVFLLVGILAGFRASYRLITRFTSLKNPEGAGLAFTDEELAKWADTDPEDFAAEESGRLYGGQESDDRP